MTDVVAGRLRVRLPDVADTDAARAALDGALRLLGLDLRDRCAPLMPEDWQFRPTRAAWEDAPTISEVDPNEWLRLLLCADHPLVRRLPHLDTSLRRDLDRVRRIRHQLYHFSRDHDVESAAGELSVLLRVARRFRLPCEREVKALRDRLRQLDPRDAEPATWADVQRHAAVVRALHDRIESVAAEHEAALAVVAAARESLQRASLLQEALLRAGAATRAELRGAHEQVEELRRELLRTQQEAEIKARHEEILLVEIDAAEASLDELPALPPLVEAALRNLRTALLGFEVLEDRGPLRALRGRAPGIALILEEQAQLLDLMGITPDALPPSEALDVAWLLGVLGLADLDRPAAAAVGQAESDVVATVAGLRGLTSNLVVVLRELLEPLAS